MSETIVQSENNKQFFRSLFRRWDENENTFWDVAANFFKSIEISVANRLNYIFGQSFINEFTEFLKVYTGLSIQLGANETLMFYKR